MPNTIQEPEDWPMQLYHGDTWPPYAFNVVDDGNAPITGFTIKMQIRDLDGNLIKTLINGSGFTITSNLVTFASTVDIAPGKYIFDIQLTLSNGEIHTQYAGSIYVVGDVSN